LCDRADAVAVASDGTRFVVVYGGADGVYARVVGAGQPGAPAQLDPVGQEASVAITGGPHGFAAVWKRRENNAYSLRGSTSTDGASWGPPTTLVSPADRDELVMASSSAGHALIFSRYNLPAQAWVHDGTGWSQTAQLGTTRTGTVALLAEASGFTALSWAQGSTPVLWRSASGSWTSSAVPATQGDTSSPGVLFAKSPTGYVAWFEGSSGSNKRFATFENGAWTVVTPSVSVESPVAMPCTATRCFVVGQRSSFGMYAPYAVAIHDGRLVELGPLLDAAPATRDGVVAFTAGRSGWGLLFRALDSSAGIDRIWAQLEL
ncbi:MAG: hypothetical protein ACK4N5_06010, partial [Myxococcales bacterium]